MTRLALVAALLAALPSLAAAQPAPRDTLRLGDLQVEAERRDPRARQLALLASQTALRLRSLDAERLPTIALAASGQYQSDVATIPLRTPTGATIAGPPHDVYDASATARTRLIDPTLAPRRAVERARLAEGEARVRATTWQLRQGVNEAFFTALLLDAQRRELETALTDLEAQRRLAATRVREGTALPSEGASIEAELLRRREMLAELAANRDAALAVLAELTARRIDSADALALPDLAGEAARARASLDTLRARPEYAQFARSRELLQRQAAVVGAQERPRLAAVTRAGYGRPGLDPLGREFDSWWVVGLQLEWNPWSWGTARRDREALQLQREIVASEEAAFTESVRRGVERDMATIDRLERTLGADDAIIALRERILRETRARFAEGVATSAEFVDRETDLLQARLARATHHVELAQARARFLTTLGIELR
jgi:outer membrane protein TolC